MPHAVSCSQFHKIAESKQCDMRTKLLSNYMISKRNKQSHKDELWQLVQQHFSYYRNIHIYTRGFMWTI